MASYLSSDSSDDEGVWKALVDQNYDIGVKLDKRATVRKKTDISVIGNNLVSIGDIENIDINNLDFVVLEDRSSTLNYNIGTTAYEPENVLIIPSDLDQPPQKEILTQNNVSEEENITSLDKDNLSLPIQDSENLPDFDEVIGTCRPIPDNDWTISHGEDFVAQNIESEEENITSLDKDNLSLPIQDSENLPDFDEVIGTCRPIPDNDLTISHGEDFVAQNIESEEENIVRSNRRKTKNEQDWSRNVNKKLRMEGKEYLGYRRKVISPGKFDVIHDVKKDARKLGPPCKSKMCKTSKLRQCDEFNDEERMSIFTNFWSKLNWDQRKQFIALNVTKKEPNQRKSDLLFSRRKDTLVYHLMLNNVNKQVCKLTFLNTLGIKDWYIRYWLRQSEDSMIPMASITNTRNPRASQPNKDFLKIFLAKLPKLESHYCRKNSSKLYLEPVIRNKLQLYEIYVDDCQQQSVQAMSRRTLDSEFESQNLSLFTPKKDKCDTCSAYEVGNITEGEWKVHCNRKDRAQEEKAEDKKAAKNGLCYVFTQDLQAVKVAPYLNASAFYFKTKLCVHNFTVYNLANRDVTTYWFDETHAGLEASVFVSCITDYIQDTLTQNEAKPVIIYSDGCGYQNRNVVLSNALLRLSVKLNVTITQKFLEKGHTHMECDSVHSRIEAKLKGKEIFLPSQYASITKLARKPPNRPYKVKVLTYDFFSDYSKKETFVYDSIRPGRIVRDPTVNDLRVLQYTPDGIIKYKINFEDELAELPRRGRLRGVIIAGDIIYPELYRDRLKITDVKWKHLQDLKCVIPQDCHAYYDSLPHQK